MSGGSVLLPSSAPTATTYVMESQELRMPRSSRPSAAPATTNGATRLALGSVLRPRLKALVLRRRSGPTEREVIDYVRNLARSRVDGGWFERLSARLSVPAQRSNVYL